MRASANPTSQPDESIDDRTRPLTEKSLLDADASGRAGADEPDDVQKALQGHLFIVRTHLVLTFE